MSDEKESYKNLPLIYRIILKFPKLSLESFSGEFQGFFWALIIPIALSMYAFVILAFMFYFPSPINIILATASTSFICILCLRILVEREIKSLKMHMEPSGFQWNVKESFVDYEKLLEKKEKSNNEQ